MKARIGHWRPGFTQPDNECLLGLVNSKQRRIADDQRGNDHNSDNAADKIGSHWRPPLCGWLRGWAGRVSSLSGRKGTTLLPPPPESRMILSVPPSMRSIVSRYMRSRVTPGAFLYCSKILRKRAV